jgi:hypothetical protein
MSTQVWIATMAAHLPEDVLVRGVTEFSEGDSSEEREVLVRGETPWNALRAALLGDVTMERWGFGPVPEGRIGFCVRAAGGLGEPELVSLRPYVYVTPAPVESP